MLIMPRPLHGVRIATLPFFHRATPHCLRHCSTSLTGLRTVPAAKISPRAVSLISAYGPSTDTATVVADPAAFEAVLARVFVSDEESPNALVRSLRDLLRRRREELAPMHEAKHRVDAFVDNRCAPLLRHTTLALLVLQFVVLFRWVFVVFDWNFVEPMTYFFGYTAVWIGLLFHYGTAGREDFTWEAIFAALSQRLRNRLYERNGIDMDRLATLEKSVKELENTLSRY